MEKAPEYRRKAQSGFTLIEILIGMSIMLLVAGMSVSFFGLIQWNTASVAGEIFNRQDAQNCINQLGRYVYPATRLENSEDGTNMVLVWRDDNAPPTNLDITDDTTGVIYFDSAQKALFYMPDREFQGNYEIVAQGIENCQMSVAGNVLRAQITFAAGPKRSPKTKTLNVSLAARNIPR